MTGLVSNLTGIKQAADELGLIGSGVSRFLVSRKLSCCCFISLNRRAFGPGTVGLCKFSSNSSTVDLLFFLPLPQNTSPPSRIVFVSASN